LLKEKTYFFVDEMQFIDERTLEHIIKANKDNTKHFYTYGLRNDFKGEMWPIINKVMNLCDSIIEICSECSICKKRKASFNKNLKQNAKENELGFHYAAACSQCFN